MTKGGANKKQTKGQRRDDVERKRDDRVRRNALKKERKIKEYLADDEDFVSFSNQLAALSLKIKDIPGDGNCLFRALGDQIEGDHTSHLRHRRETVKYMRDHRSDFEPFMEDNISFDKHLQELSKLSTHGGNDSIVAFARNHGVNIVIHQLNEPRWVIYGGEYKQKGQVRELHVSYHNGEHYSSVRHISDNSTEPGWIKHNDRVSAASTDLAIIAQTLEENAYDVDASIHYILQLICITEETGYLSQESFAASSESVNNHKHGMKCTLAVEAETHTTKNDHRNENIQENDKNDLGGETHNYSSKDDTKFSEKRTTNETEAFSNSSSGTKSKTVQDSSESLSQREQKSTKTYEHHGARPKVVEKSKNQRGSTNTHLSNKKRKELAKKEKKKRREEKRKDESNSHLESSVSQLENSSTGIVADLGLLAI
ncbi:OTU domain-containing protein 3 [Stylophora pistillata]|uniref:OTU domain-containing protein 3 n=1 Tax=Stylophora pistillata TaxID=50429 RepID=A0A2B4SLG6_STYPI|nr:OTU domain-containing protein 3 [Stylophora pistillata]